MSIIKIVNSIKVDEVDVGKTVAIDTNGDIKLVDARPYYIELTDGTYDLTQNTTAEYVYNIADFVGDDLVPVNINTIHIQTLIKQYWDWALNLYIQVKYPNTGYITIHRFDRSATAGPDVAEFQEFMHTIPIDPGQTTFEINLVGYNTEASFTILGASQVER